MRYYVAADVHGYFNELKSALTEKGYFEDKEPPTGYADKDRFLNDPTKVYDMDGDLLFDFTAVND